MIRVLWICKVLLPGTRMNFRKAKRIFDAGKSPFLATFTRAGVGNLVGIDPRNNLLSRCVTLSWE
ncbi:hypothetical protein BES34_014825 [Leptospira inadai serovar Lyme]|nr:hypothetical protein BES34_014825 [Leptospira inadai serovar Lyme]